MLTDKLANCPELREFLRNEPAATIAVPIDDEGMIHAAALLYWHSEHPSIVDPDNVFLQFTPNWARYTDYTKNYERRMLDVKE